MRTTALCASFFVAVCFFAITATAQVSQGHAREALERDCPGVRIRESGARVRQVYGVPMTERETPREAAASWLETYGAIFNGTKPTVRELSCVRLRSGKTVVTSRQFWGEVPVAGTLVTTVTVPTKTGHVVSYVGVILADPSVDSPPAPLLNASQAIAVAKQHPAGKGLTAWHDPERVAILLEEENGTQPCSVVWRCVGNSEAADDSTTFYVDTTRGILLRYHSNAVNFDVTGTVRTWLTPGLLPDPYDDEEGCARRSLLITRCPACA